MKTIVGILLALTLVTTSAIAQDRQEPVCPITQTMEVQNPELELSHYTKIQDDQAYMTLSMAMGDSLWSDLKLLNHMGITKLIIYLNSPGGAAFQGIGIADELRISSLNGLHIVIEARGIIASAAIPIFLMADKRVASKNTIFMIHPASLFKWGAFVEGLKELKSQQAMIEILDNAYAKLVASRSDLSKEKVLEMLEDTHWFTAEEAKKMGFVDEII